MSELSMIKPNVLSPFGFDSVLVKSVDVETVNQMYLDKCGYDIKGDLHNLDKIFLYECEGTGYKFWYPLSLAGNEIFYENISSLWSNYYKTDRWEYHLVHNYIKNIDRVLEIGCGRGFFLQQLEMKGGGDIMGIDFNKQAISSKVTKFPILNKDLNDLDNGEKFDVICFFQVLEHIADPYNFLLTSMGRLNKGGKLIFSVPNNRFLAHRLMHDAFDLPPHHVGHYDAEVVKKIAQHLGLRVVAIIEQELEINEPYYKNKYGLLAKGLLPILKIKNKFQKKTGHTLLSILEKS